MVLWNNMPLTIGFVSHDIADIKRNSVKHLQSLLNIQAGNITSITNDMDVAETKVRNHHYVEQVSKRLNIYKGQDRPNPFKTNF